MSKKLTTKINNFSMITFFLIIILFPLVASAKTRFSISDLDGTWYMYSIDVFPTGPAVAWDYGTVMVANGTITGGSYTFPDGSTATVNSGTLTLDQYGNTTGSIAVSYLSQELTFNFVSGKLDQSKNKATGVAVGSDGSLSLNNLFKAGQTFQQPDMAGSWYIFGTQINIAAEAVYWTRGSMTVNAEGNISGTLYLPDGSPATATGAIILNADGTFNTDASYLTITSASPTGTDLILFASGKLDKDKISGAGVSFTFDDHTTIPPVEQPIGLDHVYFQKVTGNFVTADLQGSWYMYGLMSVTQPTPAVIWNYGIATANNQGEFVSGYYVFPDGSKATITGGGLTVDMSGELTGTVTADYLGNPISMTVTTGRMDQNKNYGAFVSIADDNSLNKGFIMKSVQPTPWAFYLPAIVPKDR